MTDQPFEDIETASPPADPSRSTEVPMATDAGATEDVEEPGAARSDVEGGVE